jgi:hypothetical protein
MGTYYQNFLRYTYHNFDCQITYLIPKVKNNMLHQMIIALGTLFLSHAPSAAAASKTTPPGEESHFE